MLFGRKTTDRPDAVRGGFSELVGVNKKRIIDAIKKYSENPRYPKGPSPYGNGHASQKIFKIINNYFK
jgi:UDP-N-acetylglucosamine 2-epimerase (non-hydrolysing)